MKLAQKVSVFRRSLFAGAMVALLLNACGGDGGYGGDSGASTATASHIHTGALGVSGPISIGLTLGTNVATAPHNTPLTDQQFLNLNADNLYFNVHSTAYPNGEIRGQIVAPAPAVDVRTAVLTGDQETPAVDTLATGRGALVGDPETRAVSGGLTFSSGLTPTAAHIHLGAPGVAGPVQVGLTLSGDSAIVPANTILTQEQYNALIAGELYFNVHTTANPNGEIRGQLASNVNAVAGLANLTGAQEVPAVMTSASGKGTIVVDSATLGVFIAVVTFSGIGG